MRKLTFGMNLSLDGYIAAPGDDLGWSVPSDELFQWWSDRVGATGLALYGRKLWETMSSHWPTADQQPDATPAQIQYARRYYNGAVNNLNTRVATFPDVIPARLFGFGPAEYFEFEPAKVA